MRKKIFLFTAVLIAVFLSGCNQNVDTSKKTEKPSIVPPPPSSVTKYKITITQPANGKIEVKPDLPADGKVDKGSEFTFKLSANTNYKVKELIINGITYTDVTDNTITQKVKIEKNTAVSAVVEEEASQPAEQITIGNSVIYVTKDAGGNIIKASGTIFLNEIEELAQKSTNNIVINTDALTIKSFKSGNNTFTAYKISKDTLKKAAKALSVLNIENADSTKQAITLDENANIKTISGDISLEDIMECSNEETTEIAKYIANNLKEKTEPDFDSANLKINTFNKKPKENSENIEWEYTSTPITPKFLKETKLNALNKAVLNFKDGGISVDVSFASHQGETEEQKQKDYFDITEFYNEIENGKLKNIKNIPADKVKGNIFLRGERTYQTDGSWDITPYSKVKELVSLLRNTKLTGGRIIIGDVQLAGNIKGIIDYLNENSNNEIEEIDGGMKFKHLGTPCTGELSTGYFGENDSLTPKDVTFLYNHAIDGIVELENVTITGLNSENYKRNFIGNMLTDVSFINCDLSKISFYQSATGGGYLKFENSTLPRTMEGSVIFDLILKDSKFPDLNLSLGKTIKALPKIENSLKIYNLKNKLFDKWTKEEIEQYKMKEHGPEEFIGPRYIWEKFPYKKENTNFIEDNTTGSIQKQQNQLLALLQSQDKSHG